MRPELVAELYTPEQFKAFIFVLLAIMVVNAGAIITAVINWVRKSWKLRQDVNEAFKKIRMMERELEKLKQGDENGR